MKIPNYDKYSTNRIDRTLSGFIPENFRMLVCEQSNSGKTNVVMHMARCFLVYYDKLYLYTNNHHQEKIEDLVNKFNEISRAWL